MGSDPKAAAKSKWRILSASYQNPPAGAARNAIDGWPETFWHTHGDDGERVLPQDLAIDLGEEMTLKGFTYLPRQDGTAHGMADRYEFHVSTDGRWLRANSETSAPTPWSSPSPSRRRKRSISNSSPPARWKKTTRSSPNSE